MKTLLTDLDLSEVSLVDKGANPSAKIMLYKRDNPNEVDIDIDIARKWLKKAIKLHEAHMAGKAPTTGPDGEKSQQEMMDQMMKALAALGDINFMGGVEMDKGFKLSQSIHKIIAQVSIARSRLALNLKNSSPS